ncbi:MAG: divalent-cation tolerance protein CutA [Anaerolineae bacterium]|nr:divalent-cation tolerance protein CutA [Thermoflexales bacterium]MDW8407776.1 divalent-cation tolerance protein CutA [Anaerolineae bacterium]
MTEVIQIITTTERFEDAQKIASYLVEEGLAACVQISGPITSLYRWQGRIETAQEWQCVIKTRAALYEQVEQTIRSRHPYQTPEILAMPVVRGSAAYLDWLAEATRSL